MRNIISYVKNEGHKTFLQKKFSEVDSLVLSQLSYINFRSCTNSYDTFSFTLNEIWENYFDDSFLLNVRNPESNYDLFEAVSKSKRFGSIKVGFFDDVLDIDNEKQFAAITFLLPNDLHYVAYRGTDSTIVGWKEDFNLSFQQNIPSHFSAAEYFEKVFTQTTGKYILGGHSKGGNLAIYAAVVSPSESKDKIMKIYNHDGPGFLYGLTDYEEYKSISNKIHKTVPQSSIIGMLLHHDEPYVVVKSEAFAIMQHDPFYWIVEKGKFIELEELDAISFFARFTINKWVGNIDMQTRKLVIDGIYTIFQNIDIEEFSNAKNKRLEAMRLIYKGFKLLDKPTRKVINRVLRKLMRISLMEGQFLLNYYNLKPLEKLSLNTHDLEEEIYEVVQT